MSKGEFVDKNQNNDYYVNYYMCATIIRVKRVSKVSELLNNKTNRSWLLISTEKYNTLRLKSFNLPFFKLNFLLF